MAVNISEVFENRVRSIDRWFRGEPPTLRNRLTKFLYSPSHYFKHFVYRISKRSPVNITAKTFLGTKFYCYLPDYFWTWDCGILGDPAEISLSRFFIRNIKKGDVVLDAGANSGFYSVLSSFLVGKEGSVHAFEPTPEIFQMLRKNTRELSNIFTVRVALSDAPGEADFHLHPIHAVANSLVILPEHQGKTINVQVTTLDEYCNKNNVCPSFIKLDVEGAESKVIKGSAKTLARCAPVISLEILNQSSGADFQAATELVGYGYTPHRLKSNGDIEKISMEEVVASTTGEVNEFHNYIFKKLI